MSWSERLWQKFKETGWSKVELSRRANVPYNNVTKYLAGKVDQPRGTTLAALAKALDIDLLWLEKGIHAEGKTRLVQLVGYVGAGQHIEAIDTGFEEIEAPAGVHPKTVAAIVSGNSMLPVFQEGWVIYWSRILPPSEMLNQICVVQLAVGKIMIKTIRNGSRPGLFTLTSLNDSDIVDVLLDWAAPIDWIKPR